MAFVYGDHICEVPFAAAQLLQQRLLASGDPVWAAAGRSITAALPDETVHLDDAAAVAVGACANGLRVDERRLVPALMDLVNAIAKERASRELE